MVIFGKRQLALAVECDRTRRRADRDRLIGQQPAPGFDADGFDHARRDRRAQAPGGFVGIVEADVASLGGVAVDRVEQARDHRHADHLGFGESDEQLPEVLCAPQGAGADIAFGDDGDIDQRDFPLPGNVHLKQFVVMECDLRQPGTNNAFPRFQEPTTVGMAVGLAVSDPGLSEIAFHENKLLEVDVAGHREIALVDVAIVAERYVGARALWRAQNFKELFVTFAETEPIDKTIL